MVRKKSIPSGEQEAAQAVFKALYPLLPVRRGIGIADYEYYFSENLKKVAAKPYFPKILPNLKSFCTAVSQANVALDKEYSIHFSPQFVERDYKGRSVVYKGLYLMLLDGKGQMVGRLEFKVGFPIEIREVQGTRGGAAERFFRETGRHFETPLIDCLLSHVAAHFDATTRQYLKSPVLFSKHAFPDMKKALRNRIVDRYLSRYVRNRWRLGNQVAESHFGVKTSLIRRNRRKGTPKP